MVQAKELEAEHRHLNTNSDSEVLMGVISEEVSLHSCWHFTASLC